MGSNLGILAVSLCEMRNRHKDGFEPKKTLGYVLQRYQNSRMNKHRAKPGFWYCLASFPGGAGIAAFFEATHDEGLVKWCIAVICIFVGVLCAIIGNFLENREGAVSSRGAGRMIPFYGMIICGLGFGGFATWYFWPMQEGRVSSVSAVRSMLAMPVPQQEQQAAPKNEAEGVEVCSNPIFSIDFSNPFTVEHDDDGKTVLLWFVVRGTNKTEKYIRNISGYVEADVDGALYPIYFRIRTDEDLLKSVPPEKTKGVPPNSNFDISVDFGHVYSPGKYLPIDDILKKIGGFNLVIKSNDHACERRYPPEYVISVMENYERKRREEVLKQRKVETLE